MPKHTVVSMIMEKPLIKILGWKNPIEIEKPKGCIGVMFVWESKTAAYTWYGKKISTTRIEKENQK